MAAQINNDVICTESDLPEGNFITVAATYDKQLVMFYVNGKRVAAKTKRDGININVEDVFVGRSDTGVNTNALGGQIDWLVVYNRAISENDLRRHAEKGVLQDDLRPNSGVVLNMPFNSDFSDVLKHSVSPLGEPKLTEAR